MNRRFSNERLALLPPTRPTRATRWCCAPTSERWPSGQSSPATGSGRGHPVDRGAPAGGGAGFPRAAALTRIDWSRTFDVSRRPSLDYGSGGEGCANVVFAEFSADRAEAIAIILDGKGLSLSAGAPRTIDLARETRRVSVSVHVFDRPLRRSPFCNQVVEANNEAVWRAVRGRVTIFLSSPRSARSDLPETYRATVRLDGVEFVSNTGQRIRTTSSIELTGPVRPRRGGWFSPARRPP